MMAKKKTPPGLAKKPKKPTRRPTKPVVEETPVSKEVIRDYTPGKDSVKKGQRVMWPPAPKKGFLNFLGRVLGSEEAESDIFESKKNQKRGTVPKENANWLLVSRGKKPAPKPEPSLPVEPIPYVKGMEVFKGRQYVTGFLTWEALSNQKKSSEPKDNSRWKLVHDATPAKEEPPVVTPPKLPEIPPYVPPVEPEPIPEPEPPKEEEPKPEKPETPTPEPPVEEEPEHPEGPTTPDVPIPQIPEAPAGVRATGNILPFCRKFANNVSKQNFAWMSDGDTKTGGYHTDYDRKPFGPLDEWYVLIPEKLQASVKKIRLYDGAGTAGQPYKFTGVYKNADGSITERENIIPPFFGEKYNAWVEHNVAPENAKIFAIKNILPIRESDRSVQAAIPTEYEIIAEYTSFDKPKARPKPKVVIEQLLGMNAHHYNFAAASGRGLRQDKLNVLDGAIKEVRLYLGMEETLYEGKFTFQPISRGAWPMDDIATHCHNEGISLKICMRNMERDPRFADWVYNLIARYGSNKNIDPKTLNVYTGPGYPANEVKVGMGVIKFIQFWNEIDGGWKARNVYHTPFEMAAAQAKLYSIAKSTDPTIQVISNGFALTKPGYLEAMGYWCLLHNDGKWPFDIFSYHYYCNEKGGQRSGATGALPPEMVTYYEDAQKIKECLDYWNYDQDVRLKVGETGYSISETNPEQAVKPMGDRDRFVVAADLHARTIFDSWAAGISYLTPYNGYDTTEYIKGYGNNWDMSMGIADRNTNDIHRRRPATDYNYQMLKHLTGYHMSRESVRTAPVWEHVLSKDGAPDMLAVFVPTYEDRKVNYTVKYDLSGVKSVTLIRPVAGADNAEETDVSINGPLTVEATESILYIRVNRV